MNPISALTRLIFPQKAALRTRPTPTPSALPATPATPQTVPAASRVDTVQIAGAAQEDDLNQLLRHVAAAAKAKASPAADAENEIEALLAEIEEGERGGRGEGVGEGPRGRPPYKVTDIAAAVARHRVHGVHFPPGGSLGGEAIDVNVEILASAQPAGLFLSFGGTQIDLASIDARFTISVGGRGRATELTFASGTSLGAIAAAINSVSDVNGVRAVVSGSGVALRSTALGADEFVSVSVIDAGGVGGAGAGVYRMRGDDAFTPDAATRTAFADAEGVRDGGRDARALINGVEAEADGATLRVRTEWFRAAIALHDFAALKTGAFTAFRIVRGQ